MNDRNDSFLLNSGEFIVETYFMTNEQKGKYITLLCLRHAEGNLSNDHIAKVLSDDDEEVLEALKNFWGDFLNE